MGMRNVEYAGKRERWGDSPPGQILEGAGMVRLINALLVVVVIELAAVLWLIAGPM